MKKNSEFQIYMDSKLGVLCENSKFYVYLTVYCTLI